MPGFGKHDFVDGRDKYQDLYDKLQSSLLRKDYHSLIKVFQSVEENLSFIRSIPENTFTEILAQLQPANTLRRVKTQYSQLSSAMVRQLYLPPAEDLIREHLLKTVHILDNRKKSGRALNVADYNLILEFARWAGLKDVAETFWRSMQADQIVPDLRCYNNYLGAIVSNLRHDPIARQSCQLTTSRIEARSKPMPNARYAAYRFRAGGIRQGVMKIHREMLQNEIVPDEETFRLIILGVAREGDVDTVKKILRQVWSIDVDTIVSGPEDDCKDKGLTILPTSPLYPTQFLIHAIAHGFGINNDIPTALRLVHYMSHTYNIEVLDYIWYELFNWTFVLSLPRQASRKEHAHLPKCSVQQLWDVMRNDPYNVRPTMNMYNKLIKSLSVQQRTRDMWQYMCEALPLYEEMRQKTRDLSKTLRSVMGRSSHHAVVMESAESLHQKYMHSRLAQKTSRLWLKRWVRLLLASMHTWRKVDRDLFWSTVQIPKIVLDWKEFMPSKVWYDIPGGRVAIKLRTSHEKEAYQDQIKDVMDANDQMLEKDHHLSARLGDRYILTRRQQKRVSRRQRVGVDNMGKAEKVSAKEVGQLAMDRLTDRCRG